MPNRVTIVLSLGLIILFLCACATRTEVMPAPITINYTIGKKCPAATYSGRTTIDVKQKARGDTIDISASQISTDFFTFMSNAGIFESLVAVKEGVTFGELNLVGSFEVAYDSNPGAKVLKMLLNGFLLGLPMPFTWYNENIDVKGTLDVFERGTKVSEMKATANATLSYKILSENRVYVLQSDAIAAARTSTFKQLLTQLASYCANREYSGPQK